MSWRFRILYLMICDTVLINLAMIIPVIIRYYGGFSQQHLYDYLRLTMIATPVMMVIFWLFKLYKRVWSYASMGELLAILQSVTIGSLLIASLMSIAQSFFPLIHRNIIIHYWAYAIILIGGSRFAWRLYVHHRQNGNIPKQNNDLKKVLIYGAGDAGALVAREFKSHYNGNQPLVGFIDDDCSKHNLTIHGFPIIGNREALPAIISRYKVDELIIAMPSLHGLQIKEIVEVCKKYISNIKILPGVYQLLDGKVTLNRIRPIQIEDLLGREPVKVDIEGISQYLEDKVVLVTGAGGSIGSELCRQVAQVRPRKLILLGHGENSIHTIWLELKDAFPTLPLEIEISDVRDRHKINLVFLKHKPNVVFHAAAHKHVPLMEMHPDEAIKTNIFGTRNVAEMADRTNCERFIFISTDKAVNPSSVMGATKRMAELVIQNMFEGSKTKFVTVRFGNVLGSRGSVVPVFKKQIAKGGPVTVTHPEMKRYFMTIPEAVQLVIQAGAMAEEKEIFVLDMGEPVKIVELAKNLIKLSGFEPDVDIKIEFTGIRPGEKLFEELLTAEEGSTSTKHSRIYVARPVEIDYAMLVNELLKLDKREVTDGSELFIALQKIIPKFIHYKKHFS